jgi:hypothetical protein
MKLEAIIDRMEIKLATLTEQTAIMARAADEFEKLWLAEVERNKLLQDEVERLNWLLGNH